MSAVSSFWFVLLGASCVHEAPSSGHAVSFSIDIPAASPDVNGVSLRCSLLPDGPGDMRVRMVLVNAGQATIATLSDAQAWPTLRLESGSWILGRAGIAEYQRPPKSIDAGVALLVPPGGEATIRSRLGVETNGTHIYSSFGHLEFTGSRALTCDTPYWIWTGVPVPIETPANWVRSGEVWIGAYLVSPDTDHP